MTALKVHEAKALKQKIFGLLLYKKPTNLLLKTRFGIHTFGMHYPIDVIILDANNRVVRLKENLKPNRIFLWHPKYAFVLELEPGTVTRSKINIGTSINLKI